MIKFLRVLPSKILQMNASEKLFGSTGTTASGCLFKDACKKKRKKTLLLFIFYKKKVENIVVILLYEV